MNRLVLDSFSRFSCKYWAFNFARVPTRLLHKPSKYFGNQLLSKTSNRVPLGPLERQCAKCSWRRYFGSLTRSSQVRNVRISRKHTLHNLENNLWLPQILIFSYKQCGQRGDYLLPGGGGGGRTPIYGLYGYVPLNRVCFLVL